MPRFIETQDEVTPSDTFSATVTAMTYHTVDHTTVHLPGEVYAVTDPHLFETLVACGFADPSPPPPPE